MQESLQFFINHKLISEEEYEALQDSNENMFTKLLDEGKVPLDELCDLLEKEYGIPFLDLSESDVSCTASSLLPYDIAVKYTVLPLSLQQNSLVLAMSNPFDYLASGDVQAKTQSQVKRVFAREATIQRLIHKLYASDQISQISSQFIVNENLKKQSVDLGQRAEIQNAPAVQLIDSLLNMAIASRASDIHIEPEQHLVRCRIRIDGVLKNLQFIEPALLPSIVSRVKIMAGMDISEKRRPQDGHFEIKSPVHLNFRVSTIPTIHGEKTAIRLMSSATHKLHKERLGFSQKDLQQISLMFRNHSGLILVTGPTGSGKTTTLATFLEELNKETVNIITIEDPVEYVIDGINQINVNPKAGIDFATTLRAILRQDPDIMMVGEIRDQETASIAVRAAMTGHLVLSTIHTNDAVSAMVRLIDMGVESFLVTAALRGIIAQRLVRKICPHCKQQILMEKSSFLKIPEGTTIYEGKGCSHCNETGYMGQFAVYEYIHLDGEFRHLLSTSGVDKTLYETIHTHLEHIGFESLIENGIKQVLAGNTTVSEILRIVMEY